MKKSILTFLCILFLLGITTCEPQIDPKSLEKPTINGIAPTITFTQEVPQFTCGEAITKETILNLLNDKRFATISSNDDEPCAISVADFTIAPHTHGYVNIDFVASDSANNVSKGTITIYIAANKTKDPITLQYNGPTPFELPFGIDPALIINNLLRDPNSGFSVSNSNLCDHQKPYTLIEPVYPKVGEHYFYKVAGTYDNVKFKVKSKNQVVSNEISLTIKIDSSNAKPNIYPPDDPLIHEIETSITNEDVITYLKNNMLIFSSDPFVNMDNISFTVLTTPDSSKLGIQRIYFYITDTNGNKSDMAFMRINYKSQNISTTENILKDPSFEEAPAPLNGTITDEFYRDKRLSSNWKINQTMMFFTNPFVGEGGGDRPNTPLNQKSKSITGNDNDLLQGPIILDPADFPSVSSFKEDKGYELVKDKSLYGLEGITTLKHMVVYRASEKAVTGGHSFALRGKSYDIGINKNDSSQTARFFGVGSELCQTVTLKKDDVCSFSAQIIKDFGHDQPGELNGMVGAIYISLYEEGNPNNIIKELHIHSHCTNRSDYGQFKRYGSNTDYQGAVISEGTFAIPKDGNYVFSIRKYLSNDDGGKSESQSSWGYSPTYVDDCELNVTRLRQFESHIDEELQTPPTL